MAQEYDKKQKAIDLLGNPFLKDVIAEQKAGLLARFPSESVSKLGELQAQYNALTEFETSLINTITEAANAV